MKMSSGIRFCTKFLYQLLIVKNSLITVHFGWQKNNLEQKYSYEAGHGNISVYQNMILSKI